MPSRSSQVFSDDESSDARGGGYDSVDFPYNSDSQRSSGRSHLEEDMVEYNTPPKKPADSDEDGSEEAFWEEELPQKEEEEEEEEEEAEEPPQDSDEELPQGSEEEKKKAPPGPVEDDSDDSGDGEPAVTSAMKRGRSADDAGTSGAKKTKK
jgi:hypothetical protein